MSIGSCLKAIREEKKVTVNQLAQLSKQPRVLITQVERDKRLPSINQLQAICAGLDLPIYQFWVKLYIDSQLEETISLADIQPVILCIDTLAQFGNKPLTKVKPVGLLPPRLPLTTVPALTRQPKPVRQYDGALLRALIRYQRIKMLTNQQLGDQLSLTADEVSLLKNNKLPYSPLIKSEIEYLVGNDPDYWD